HCPCSSQLPMRVERAAGPKHSLAPGFWYGTLRTDVVDQCDGDVILFPLDAAVGKEAPIAKVGVRLIRAVVKILYERDGRRSGPTNLRAITGQLVRIREIVIAVDDVEGAFHRFSDLILGSDSKHEVRRIVWQVAPRVVEIVLRIE